MTRSILDLQDELPKSIALFRYTPRRASFSWRDWDPCLVRSADDIPEYLILGKLDRSTFEQSANGWRARWQGNEYDTHFDVACDATERRLEISQTWCGLDGGTSVFSTDVAIERAIGNVLYTQFPRSWDREAKSQLESEYQLKFVQQSEDLYTICGIPDGAFRTIAFPIAVRNLRVIQAWIQDIVADSPPVYPISVDAKLLCQAINYLEGKAPEWTSKKSVVFNQSLAETGLAPQGFPVREVAKDGSAAWTLRRENYFLFIVLPFAGLTDFLSRMVTVNGPIRASNKPELRFELQPFVMPDGYELQTESMSIWNHTQTTRLFLQFAPTADATKVTIVEDALQSEDDAANYLLRAEAISRDIVESIEQTFQKVT